jgi:peptidoglycan hydrolase-like protein with peptidoglycan-binding domain
MLLAACGHAPLERGVTGAGLGAGAGAALGAIAGAPGTGAAMGAAAGGMIGALTGSHQINLGDPPWRQGGYSDSRPGGPSEFVAWIQGRLNALGYDAGPPDGVAGPQTRSAIRAYQRDHGLLVDGVPSQALADHMYRRG